MTESRVVVSPQRNTRSLKFRVAMMLAPVEFGGAERVCFNLLRGIDRKRFDMHAILLTRPWEPNSAFVRAVQAEGIAYSEIPVAVRRGSDPLRVLRSFVRTRQILARHDFQLLHTNGYFADVIGIAAARIARIPCVSTCHGFITNSWKYRLYNALDRLALRWANRVIAVSTDLSEHLASHGIPPGRLFVVENAVDASVQAERDPTATLETRRAFGLGEDDFVVGYLGRLSHEKGVRNLLLASAYSSQWGLRFKMLIVGDGPERQALEQLAQQLDLSERIRFLGFRHDTTELLDQMDAFVLPSLTEGTPMALLEAMSRRVPVVATAVGGVPGVIDDEDNGLLVLPSSPAAIAEALNRLSSDGDLRTRLAERGANTVRERYGMDNWLSRMMKEYSELAKHS
jgi:glycosyltransferase involved in cell wall biosynthesis